MGDTNRTYFIVLLCTQIAKQEKMLNKGSSFFFFIYYPRLHLELQGFCLRYLLEQ